MLSAIRGSALQTIQWPLDRVAEVNAMPGLLETPPMDIQAVHWLGCSSVTILELQGQNAFM